MPRRRGVAQEVRDRFDEILAKLDGFDDQQWEGLKLLNDHSPLPYKKVGGPQYAHFTWADFLDRPELDDSLPTLLTLLGAIRSRLSDLDGGLVMVIGDYFLGHADMTGAIGALKTAKHVLDANPGTTIVFEVGSLDLRRLDIVAYDMVATITDGVIVRRILLEIEVKNYPGGVLGDEAREKIIGQMGKELLRHVGDDPPLSGLQWLLDPDGYHALGDQFRDMFFVALKL